MTYNTKESAAVAFHEALHTDEVINPWVKVEGSSVEEGEVKETGSTARPAYGLLRPPAGERPLRTVSPAAEITCYMLYAIYPLRNSSPRRIPRKTNKVITSERALSYDSATIYNIETTIFKKLVDLLPEAAPLGQSALSTGGLAKNCGASRA
jgi:hypothetical protein